MTTIVIDPPCAFLNANDRPHHHAKAKLTKAWRASAQAAIWVNPRVQPKHQYAHIIVSIRWPDKRRRDPGNWYPTAKAIVDGLVDAGVLIDDDDAHVIGPDMRREYPNGPARVTVTIEELDLP